MSEAAVKCEEYHAWGVKHTRIFDPESKRSWEYHSGERLHEVASGETINADKIAIPVKEIFAGLD